jgi:hypothetical protein
VYLNGQEQCNNITDYFTVSGCGEDCELIGGYSVASGSVSRYGDWPSQYLSLQRAQVEVESDAQNGTEPWHWKLNWENQSFVELSFDLAAIPFPDSMKLRFLGLGSTRSGQSYAYVRVLINGSELVDCFHLDESWLWYFVSWNTLQNYLVSGLNTFRVQLATSCDAEPQTNAWIKNIEVNAWGAPATLKEPGTSESVIRAVSVQSGREIRPKGRSTTVEH